MNDPVNVELLTAPNSSVAAGVRINGTNIRVPSDTTVTVQACEYDLTRVTLTIYADRIQVTEQN